MTPPATLPRSARPASPRRPAARLAAAASVSVALASTAAVALATPVSAAAPVFHASYTDSFAFDDQLCSLDLHLEREVRESVVVRVARNSGGEAFLATSTVHVTDVVSLVDDDPTTGAYVTADFHSSFIEQHATQVEGTVFDFSGVDAGTFALYDSAGTRLVHERGVRLFTDTFDTLGDGEPGGVYLDSVSVPHGPHLAGEDFCGILVDQLT